MRLELQCRGRIRSVPHLCNHLSTEPGQLHPPNPGDSKNCSDFSTHNEAQAWFDKYYPYYGDVARLDRDNDLIACESLP